jgi:hypothetical protein
VAFAHPPWSRVSVGCSAGTTHPGRGFLWVTIFFLSFVFSTFLGVSRQGKSKNTIQIILQKVHVENRKLFPKKSTQKKFDVSFPSTFFVLSRFRVFLSGGSSKTLQKNVLQKNRVEKFLQKNRQKKPKPICPRLF